MRRYPIYMMVLFLSVWTLSGCSLKVDQAPAAPAEPEPPVVSVPSDEPSDNSYYHYMEAQLQRKKGHRDKAIEYLEQAIALDGESLLLKRELAALYSDQKDYPKAVEILDGILAREPLDVDALAMVGRLFQQLDQPQKAKAAYEKALANDPERESIYPALGRIYMAEDSLPDAQRVFNELVRHFPGSFVGHFYLGRIYAKQGRPAAAKAAFEKTLVLEPALLEPRFELIDLLRSEVPEGQWVTVENGETLGGISRRVYDRYDARCRTGPVGSQSETVGCPRYPRRTETAVSQAFGD